VTTLVCLFCFTHEAAGALGTRHSPRPRFLGERFKHNSGPSRREIVEACFGFDVIARSDLSAEARRAKAEATKQSILTVAMAVDCFAEPASGAHSRDPLARNDALKTRHTLNCRRPA
jgi:hypothetical protein